MAHSHPVQPIFMSSASTIRNNNNTRFSLRILTHNKNNTFRINTLIWVMSWQCALLGSRLSLAPPKLALHIYIYKFLCDSQHFHSYTRFAICCVSARSRYSNKKNILCKFYVFLSLDCELWRWPRVWLAGVSACFLLIIFLPSIVCALPLNVDGIVRLYLHYYYYYYNRKRMLKVWHSCFAVLFATRAHILSLGSKLSLAHAHSSSAHWGHDNFLMLSPL